MKLYICEKPSQGKDLARNLGLSGGANGYIGNKQVAVTWAIGHLLQQAMPQDYDPIFADWKKSFNSLPMIPDNNGWKMLVNPKTKKQIAVVRGLLKIATEVVIATDGDREGEAIGRELLDFYNFKGQISRLWLTALDDGSIQKALKDIRKGSDYVNLYHSALARSRADWMVGLNLTQFMTVKAGKQGYQGVLSIGRVQTPTLKMIVDRDKEIADFKANDYYDITGVFSGIKANWKPVIDDTNFDAEGRCLSLEHTTKIADIIKNNTTAIITVFDTNRKKITPPLCYSLSSLQQEANKKFGFGAKQVLSLAQSLYEKHKATTYPRSDCSYLPTDQLNEASSILNTISSIDNDYTYLIKNCDKSIKSKVWNDKKLSAHHAIIPTNNANVDISKMTTDECKLYDLIARRYIAQFYPNYEYDKTDIVIDCSDEKFVNTVNIDVKLGWKTVINSATQLKTEELPIFVVGDTLDVKGVSVITKQTKPPAHYTEGSLVADMKSAHKFITDDNLKQYLKGNEGIGTEATRANIIDLLKNRKYVESKKKNIVATQTGNEVISIIPNELKDLGMTALMEVSLDKIVSGETSLEEYLDYQANWLRQIIDNLKDEPLNLKLDIKSHPCPTCGSDMFLKSGKKGSFWGCSNYPDCKTIAQNNNGKPLFESDMPDCPKCGKKLRKVKGAKGYFWSCKGYFDTPKCEFSANDKGGKPVL